jgi:hypothetical protein
MSGGGGARYARGAFGGARSGGSYSNASASAAAGAIPGYRSYDEPAPVLEPVYDEFGGAGEDLEVAQPYPPPPPVRGGRAARVPAVPVDYALDAPVAWDTISIPAEYTQKMILRVMLFLVGKLPSGAGPLPDMIDLTDLGALHADHRLSVLGFITMVFGHIPSVHSGLLVSAALHYAGYDRGDAVVSFDTLVGREYVLTRTNEMLVRMGREPVVVRSTGGGSGVVAAGRAPIEHEPVAAAAGAPEQLEDVDEEHAATQPTRPLKRVRVRDVPVE